ncbi:MAG: AMP-binding protein [Alphaproteobacteria bacterium]|nr:AMP-binding protein [Alphaproteobacteria bacterium]
MPDISSNSDPADFSSVVQMLARAAATSPSHEALVCGSVRLTYGEYANCVAGFAAQLSTMGARGGRVAIVFGNSIEYCIALMGGWAAGAQVAPINPLLTADEIGPLLEDIEAAAIIYDEAVAALIEPLAQRYKIPHRIVVRLGDGEGLLRWRRLSGTITADMIPAKEAYSLLLYTGGTTGIPKGVNLTHHSGVSGIVQFNTLVPTRKGIERLLCVGPLSHVYSLQVAMYNMLNCGGTMVILPRYSAEATLDMLEQERITILAGGPTMFVGMLGHFSIAGRDFSQLRYTLSGGSALPEDTLRRWYAATGAPVLEGFGQTETHGAVSFNPLDGVQKPASVGIATADADIEIVDAIDGVTVLAPGATGEIRLRGPQIMAGYRRRPAETAATLREGWLYTSDVGHIDSDGYLFVSDRKKDMVIVSGFNVYPRAVEEVLYQHPEVAEAAVVGVPDEYQGESLRAFIVLRPGSNEDPDAIKHYCREHLAPYKIPRRISFVPVLPKTTVGKIDKRRLRDGS